MFMDIFMNLQMSFVWEHGAALLTFVSLAQDINSSRDSIIEEKITTVPAKNKRKSNTPPITPYSIWEYCCSRFLRLH
jgi:hypothetical protein